MSRYETNDENLDRISRLNETVQSTYLDDWPCTCHRILINEETGTDNIAELLPPACAGAGVFVRLRRLNADVRMFNHSLSDDVRPHADPRQPLRG